MRGLGAAGHGYPGNIYEVALNSPTANAMPGYSAPNVYQGVVSGNQVLFLGVPVLAPGNNGVRVLRINIRVDASQLFAGIGSSPVQAGIVSSDPTDFPLANPTPIFGFRAAEPNHFDNDFGCNPRPACGLWFAFTAAGGDYFSRRGFLIT